MNRSSKRFLLLCIIFLKSLPITLVVGIVTLAIYIVSLFVSINDTFINISIGVLSGLLVSNLFYFAGLYRQDMQNYLLIYRFMQGLLKNVENNETIDFTEIFSKKTKDTLSDLTVNITVLKFYNNLIFTIESIEKSIIQNPNQDLKKSLESIKGICEKLPI